MNRNEVIEILRNTVMQISPETNFDELNLSRPLNEQIEIDSYDFYKILVRLEEKTQVRMPEMTLRKFSNLNELIQFISKQTQKQTNDKSI